MATPLQFRRGNSTTRLGVTLDAGEAYFDTDVFQWFVGDGSQLGGYIVANFLVEEITGTTHTVNAGDNGKFFVYTNAAGCAVTVAQAGSGGGTYFPNKAGFWAINVGTGVVVITPTTSQINNVASVSLAQLDSGCFVSDGADYFGPVSRSSASVIMAVHVVGNTTGASSTSTLSNTNLTISAAGALSAGMSGSTLILSAPAGGATTDSEFVRGNTTGGTSSTTGPTAVRDFQGLGAVTVGFTTTGTDSHPVLQISGPASTYGATAFGNTTASTSSTALTTNALSVSGSGGVSVGFSGGTLVIAGASGGGVTQSASVSGNTTGSTSSTTLDLSNAPVISGAGGVSVGYSGSTLIISGATGGGAIPFATTLAAFSSTTTTGSGAGSGITFVPGTAAIVNSVSDGDSYRITATLRHTNVEGNWALMVSTAQLVGDSYFFQYQADGNIIIATTSVSIRSAGTGSYTAYTGWTTITAIITFGSSANALQMTDAGRTQSNTNINFIGSNMWVGIRTLNATNIGKVVVEKLAP